MDQDPNAPPQAKRVGKAANAGAANSRDPQWWLAGSVHPYAPFVGNALKWESYVYDDGTTYEGLMMLDVPHNKGTIVFGSGFGGGIQRSERGDKFEGEFDTGFAHGLGQYSSTNKNKVYRGEYNVGQRHGCGAEYDMAPYIKKVEGGADPDAAWVESQPDIERKAKYGTWLRDTFFTGPDDSGRYCHMKEIKGTLQEVSEVLAKVRMFQNKPDGEVMFRFSQDANGLPAPVMQDPLHYPHGTAFLAPGPLGQCHAVPEDPKIRDAMTRAAANHQRIYDSYNLPYETQPGSDLDKAQRLWKKKQTRKQRALEKKLQREQQRIRRLDGGSAAAVEEDITKGGKGGADGGEEEFDDDDLIASIPSSQEQQQQLGNGNPPSMVASVSIGLSRAAVALQQAFHRAAVTAPPRRCLTRPSHSRR